MVTVLSETRPIAKKQHRCEWCGGNIEPGEKYYRWAGIYDGFQSWCMHEECKDALSREVDDDRYWDDEFPSCEHERGMTLWEMEKSKKGISYGRIE